MAVAAATAQQAHQPAAIFYSIVYPRPVMVEMAVTVVAEEMVVMEAKVDLAAT
jgi:hypothetical protein